MLCVCIGAKLFYSLYSHSYSFTTTTRPTRAQQLQKNNFANTPPSSFYLAIHPPSVNRPPFLCILTYSHARTNFTHSTRGLSECAGECGGALANRRWRAPLKSITHTVYISYVLQTLAHARAPIAKINNEKRSCSPGVSKWKLCEQLTVTLWMWIVGPTCEAQRFSIGPSLTVECTHDVSCMVLEYFIIFENGGYALTAQPRQD